MFLTYYGISIIKSLYQWSKAIYTYGMAVCLLEVGNGSQKKDATKLLEKVPGLRQKIAGKSIPLEVCFRFFPIPGWWLRYFIEICSP